VVTLLTDTMAMANDRRSLTSNRMFIFTNLLACLSRKENNVYKVRDFAISRRFIPCVVDTVVIGLLISLSLSKT